MSMLAVKPPARTSGHFEMLISDFIIGGCIGSMVAPLLISLFNLAPGLTGIGCTVGGACLGAVAYRLREAYAT
jgi:hypothetical protein